MRIAWIAPFLAVLWAAGLGLADETDAAKLLGELTVANAAKDAVKITGLLKKIQEAGKATEDQAIRDALAAELCKSLKVLKKDYGALGDIVDTLAGLRSKSSVSSLKRIAFRKEPDSEQQADVQAKALIALGKLADTRLLNGIADQTKNRNETAAKGAYKALGSYGASRGKTRKKVAEILMKRLQSEYPSYSSAKGVSSEKRKRWRVVASSIVESLRLVCREKTLADVPAWQEWWKENKRNAKAWRDD